MNGPSPGMVVARSPCELTTTSETAAAKREELWFLVKLALLFAVAVGVFLLLSKLRSDLGNSQFPRVQLSDGTWLVARSVSTGTSHSIEIPYPFDIQLSRWQRSYTSSHTTQSDRMVIWLTHENSRGEILDLDWFAKCQLVLADDYRVNPNNYQRQIITGNSSSGSGVGSTGYSDATAFGPSKKQQMAIIHFDLPVVRPRNGSMTLDIHDGVGEVIAQLEVPYPRLPNMILEDWEPEPLPATRTVGNLSVTLNSMKYHSHTQGIAANPQLKYVHDGLNSNTWSALIEILDQVGNVSSNYNCDLSPLESAWKLRLTLHQTHNGRFLAEETHKLALKQLPAAKQLVLTTETHTVNEVPVSLVGIGGTGPIEFTLPNSTATFKTGEYKPGQSAYGMSTSCSGSTCNVELTSGHPFLITGSNTSGHYGDVQFVIRDQDGVNLTQGGSSGAQGMTFWHFEPKSTSTAIEIEIISQKARTVEFLIAPPKPDEIQKSQ